VHACHCETDELPRETSIKDPAALDVLSRLENLAPLDERMAVTGGTYLYKEEEEFSVHS
jgi:hypothetical protein